MIYGRPVAIPRDHLQYCDIPAAVDDRFTVQGKEQPSDVLSSIAFFVANITLYLVIDDILSRLYRGRATTRRPGAMPSKLGLQFPFIHLPVEPESDTPLAYLSAVVELEKELMDWYSSLPELLKFSLEDVHPDTRGNPALQRQRNILHARYANTIPF
jgi:hypothetical protein